MAEDTTDYSINDNGQSDNYTGPTYGNAITAPASSGFSIGNFMGGLNSFLGAAAPLAGTVATYLKPTNTKAAGTAGAAKGILGKNQVATTPAKPSWLMPALIGGGVLILVVVGFALFKKK